MTTLITAVFIASLLGSLHCVGMCGAFLATIAADGSRRATQIGYHGGRLLTYLTLGTIAGAVGRSLNLAGAMAGLQPIATVLSAVAIVLMGTLTWMRLKGFQLPLPHGPQWIGRTAANGYRFAMKRPPVQRALIVGLLTTLLPCGWLWTFLITAGGTAHPATAALTMLVFWAGTLPAMVAFGVSIRGILGPAQRRVPTLTCAAMIAIGLITIIGRMRLDSSAWAAVPSTQPIATQLAQQPPCCETTHAHVD
jgi:sulfite exporter TauE/SafE